MDIRREPENMRYFLIIIFLVAGCTTSLHEAVKQGDVQQAQALLKKGADINAKNEGGLTPLHEAARNGHKELAKLLIRSGADVNAKANEGSTPLHTAVQNGQLTLAELLILHGANVNAKNPAGQTPMHVATRNGHAELAELLAQKGADVNARDKDRCSSLHLVAKGCQTELAVMLIQRGADVDVQDANGATPLHWASGKGEHLPMKLFRFSTEGTTKCLELISLLLSKGADVNAKNKAGETPLHWACYTKHKDLAEHLIQGGADVNIRSEGMHEHVMSYSHTFLTSKITLRYSHRVSPIHLALWAFDEELVQLLISNGADVNSRSYTMFPLGFDSILSTDDYTPLHWAVLFGQTDIAELLILNGANVNAKTSYELRPVEVNPNLTVVWVDPAYVKVEGFRAYTPLHIAVLRAGLDKNKSVRLLVRMGADLDAKNHEGQTPLDLAKSKGHKEIVELLKTADAVTDQIE